MQFSGIHTLTLLDYPDRVAAIVFTPGCNMRCHFCHNSEFVLPEELKKIQHDFIPEEKVLHFLETRKGFLDGLVISGGEPTIFGEALISFLQKVRVLGFLIKLDTNGTHPEVLEKIFHKKLVDYVAMDIKASPERYNEITGVANDFSAITKSKDLILASGVEYEFRTTVIHGFHNASELDCIGRFIQGAKKYTLQNYRNGKVLDPEWKKFMGFSTTELKMMEMQMRAFAEKVVVME